MGMDITSSYPYSLWHDLYPMKPFVKSDEDWTLDEILHFKAVYNKAFLLRIGLHHVKLADQMFGFPYIPFAKLTQHGGVKKDNGRILEGDYVELWITDVDLDIIRKEYTFTQEDILEVYVSQYGRLPRQMLGVVRQLFEDKSKLKGIPGEEMHYAMTKALLNSVYGLTAQDVGKPQYKFDGDNIYLDFAQSLEEILQNARKNPYMCYQWGVWVTAHSRMRLHRGLWSVYEQGADPIYVDTDSIKFIGSADFTAVNRECYTNELTAETVTGKKTTLGTYTFDGHYKRFITYGAKKYAYEDDDGELHITIAGVNKKKGAEELRAAGGLEALKEGFTFREAAGAAAHYNDHPLEIIQYQGHDLELSSNVALTRSAYTLGLTGEYEDIVYDSRLMTTIKSTIDLLFEMH